MMIRNKIYVALFLITGLYSYFILTTHTILGKNWTAPFSNISFIDYLLQLSPILMLMLIFYTLKLFSKKYKDLDMLLSTCQMSQKKLFNIRLVAVAIAYFILVILVMVLSFVFYHFLFGYHNYITFGAITCGFFIGSLSIWAAITILCRKYFIQFGKS